jgi:hypothetical protein
MNKKIIVLFMLLAFLSGTSAEAFSLFGNNHRGWGCHRHHHRHHHHRGW